MCKCEETNKKKLDSLTELVKTLHQKMDEKLPVEILTLSRLDSLIPTESRRNSSCVITNESDNIENVEPQNQEEVLEFQNSLDEDLHETPLNQRNRKMSKEITHDCTRNKKWFSHIKC